MPQPERSRRVHVSARRRKSIRLGVRVDRELHDLVQMVALQEGRTVSSVVREAVKRLAIERIVYDLCK